MCLRYIGQYCCIFSIDCETRDEMLDSLGEHEYQEDFDRGLDDHLNFSDHFDSGFDTEPLYRFQITLIVVRPRLEMFESRPCGFVPYWAVTIVSYWTVCGCLSELISWFSCWILSDWHDLCLIEHDLCFFTYWNMIPQCWIGSKRTPWKSEHYLQYFP